MRRALVGIWALAGCGRIAFEPLGDGGGSLDARRDCWSAWTTGPLQLSTPRVVPELSTPQSEGDPWLSPDALALYFGRAAGARSYHVARRADRASPWQAPVPFAELSSPGDDSKLSFTADGLLAIWSSDRATLMDYDLWQARRNSAAEPFGAPSRVPFAAINDNLNQYDPHLSADGLRLYYAPDTAAGQVIRLATRSSLDDAFGPGEDVALAHMPVGDPALSPDELVMLYSAQDPGPELLLYYASRPAIGVPFGTGALLPIYEAPVHDQDPAISYDGCEIYFASRRGGGAYDLYVTFVR